MYPVSPGVIDMGINSKVSINSVYSLALVLKPHRYLDTEGTRERRKKELTGDLLKTVMKYEWRGFGHNVSIDSNFVVL